LTEPPVVARFVSAARGSVSRFRDFERSGIGARTLLLSLAALASLCAYRTYSFVLTGFFVSDEFGYAYTAMHGTVYGGRWFFGWLNVLLFRVLGVTSTGSFAILLPFYMFFWSACTLILFYALMRLVELDQRTISLSLFLSLFLVSFVLLSLGFLTEPVGLTLAMAGIYCAMRFQMAKSVKGRVALPLLSGLLLVAASGTREPYYAFLVGVGVLVVFIAFVQARERRGTHAGWLALLSIALFVVPAVGSFYLPGSAGTQTLTTGGQFLASLVSNPSNSLQNVPVTTVTSTVATVSSGATKTVTITTTLTTAPSFSFFPGPLLLNTLVIFVGGIFIGWGPIPFAVALFGVLLLFRDSARRKDSTRPMSLFLAIVALGSYLVVSFIFAPDPSYFSFGNYSTIIRFSDTAIPAFFLTAPFAVSAISRRKMLTYGLVALLVIFVVAAVPVYESYATSNLNLGGINPFDLSYRSPAFQIRDYALANPDQTLNIVGLPYGWYFSTGLDSLHNTTVYALYGPAAVPVLNYTSFIKYRWSTFYVCSTPGFQEVKEYAPYLLPLVQPGTGNQTSATPFRLSASQTVFSNAQFVFVRISLIWNSA
jgi:hypothetical protein